MYAEAALRQSKSNLIESDVRNGLIVIFHEAEITEQFRLFFVPVEESRKAESLESSSEIGSYDDLDTAVTIACIGYGAYEARWIPSRTSRFLSGGNFE